ncbi:uncharacterized protein A1O5_09192 [Cladophialophora psammophila CBS 110553]|uniref:Uncharacterized protein n=1 Tax=Cladophialophora psammophila CBS 110553 TaxID=1182543 RepID=W9WT99_9EURO|nr:uncharacterized protein A1O5_09192 [Cladophialophora psammophila CBS 110553]EXJ67846.1 hypothetical protein A1O5_09192 [Cladophialophora psammophila CBS 110553]
MLALFGLICDQPNRSPTDPAQPLCLVTVRALFDLADAESHEDGRLKLVLKDRSPGEWDEFSVSSKGEDYRVPEALVVLLDQKIWFALCLNLDVGFAEAYMRRELQCNNLVDLFSIYIQNWATLSHGSPWLQRVPRILRLMFKPTNDVKHALQNASSHYDTWKYWEIT